MASENLDQGRRVRSAIMGEDVIDGVFDRAGRLERAQQELFTEFAWGTVFQRDGLSRKTRLLINIAVLAILGERDTMKLHVQAASRLGCTADEIGETIIQAGAVGIGGVRTVLACRAADEALADLAAAGIPLKGQR